MQQEIIEHEDNLPTTIEELIDFVIVGNEAIKSFKAKLRACNKAELAKNAKEQALMDGRKVSRLVYDAEIRLGELLSNIEPKRNKEGGTQSTSLKSLPEGITKDESRYAQEFYRNQEVVNEIFETKKNDIPSVHDGLKAIKHKKRYENIQKQKEEIKQGLEKPTGRYDIIVIDPPWTFEGGETSYDADGRRTTATYPTMSYNEIKNINIPSDNNCILWLWSTHKDIWMAKEILEYWGFDYKCILVWDKQKMGIGRWLRLQTEFCLLGIKGKPLWENKDIRDIIYEPRTTHSVKPELFYKMIDNNFIGRKLDYFGRKKRKGWDIFGAGQNSLSK